jgi:hypothetical protein
MSTSFICSVAEMIEALRKVSLDNVLCIHVRSRGEEKILEGIPLEDSFLFSHDRTRLTYIHLLDKDPTHSHEGGNSWKKVQIQFPSIQGNKLFYSWIGYENARGGIKNIEGRGLARNLIRNIRSLYISKAYSSLTPSEKERPVPVTRGAMDLFEKGYEFYFAINEVRHYPLLVGNGSRPENAVKKW